MMTAARVTDAAKEAASLLAKGGKAAAEVVRSDARDNLSLNAALELSTVHAEYGAVIKKLEVNEPDVLAAYKFTREVNREYLERRAPEQPRAAVQRSVVRLERWTAWLLPAVGF